MVDQATVEAERPVLVLFRNDLRLADNRALSAAAESGRPVIPVFILDEVSDGIRAIGAARRWWLHHALSAFSPSIERLGAKLVLRRGATATVVDEVLAETDADAVFWNRRYDPSEIAVDTALKAMLKERGIAAESFDGQLLHEPSQVKTGAGGPFKVYSPFWRALVAGDEPRDPVDAPATLREWTGALQSDRLEDWNLLPQKPDWAGGLREEWVPGEAAAQEALEHFLEGAIDGYGEGRDIPGRVGTSRLSPYLTNGDITPFQILATAKAKTKHAPASDLEKFRKELAWREFAYHILFHHPDLAMKHFNPGFDSFTFVRDDKGLSAWKRGETGYPIVDAGMRQLWQTGWMHNRVRMIVASFLVKHLLIDWREGEKWFWDTLVDADPANNPASWQWVAGSGADAAPYFRVFNPTLQGEKFDPKGDYVRRFVPELERVPDRFIHRPWEAPEFVLAESGVKLGQTYPVPVIDHQRGRQRAMAAYATMRGDL